MDCKKASLRLRILSIVRKLATENKLLRNVAAVTRHFEPARRIFQERNRCLLLRAHTRLRRWRCTDTMHQLTVECGNFPAPARDRLQPRGQLNCCQRLMSRLGRPVVFGFVQRSSSFVTRSTECIHGQQGRQFG